MERRMLLKVLGLVPLNRELISFLFKEQEVRISSRFLMYHEVTDRGMTLELVSLIQAGYQPISLETLVGVFRGEIIIPQNLKTFMVTCDDGLLSQYEEGLKAVERVERETGWFVPLTLFVMTRFEGLANIEEIADDTPSFNDRVHSYMTKGQIVELIKKGHFVENHTIDHINITQLSESERSLQVERGEERINTLWELSGRERTCRAFAYPYGRFRGQERYIKSLGYDLAFTTLQTTQHSSLTPYTLGRIGRT